MNRRQRLLTRKRMTNAGTMTNYEMAHLREEGWWRETRWLLAWESLADTVHPRSKAEWDAHLKGDDHGHRPDC